MGWFLKYLLVFIVGGLLCAIAQVLLDKTKLTSARILVIYVVSGVFLSAVGIYSKLVAIGGCGAT
ncbi:MAG: SpoVA/SpoVAEb family sporulation membrane protein, partial [Clostridia bacterium]|nr:SpoVA/SpoVAEb family sporulation membrane protein [Clostridia bacterium]